MGLHRKTAKSMVGGWLGAALAGVLTLLSALSLQAQTILRDPDIEHALAKLAHPMITAAGLSPVRLKILVLQDSALNAFVASPNHIFIHSGLLLRMKTPEELQAVIAHEIAHIANGHLARRALNARAARNTALLGAALSAVAAASGGGKAAAGLLAGTASSAQRVFLGHTRAEEASADQSAIRFMSAHGINPLGMVDVLEIFRGQEALSSSRQDPYVLTHPLTRDRIRAVKGYAAAAAGKVSAQPDDAYWFARARGKLEAFILNPKTVLRKIKPGDQSDIGMMRRAIALYRTPKSDAAIAEISALTARKPNDPYLAELKGQILLDSRKFSAAVSAYRRAAELDPKNALILAGYGRALLALDSADGNRTALDVLQRAYDRDPFSPRMLRDLGLAYARAGQPGMAALVTAERYALRGRLQDALPHAKRAVDLLKRGTSGWNRAQDILQAAEAAEK